MRLRYFRFRRMGDTGFIGVDGRWVSDTKVFCGWSCHQLANGQGWQREWFIGPFAVGVVDLNTWVLA